MTLLAILSTQERRQFDAPPTFNSDERIVYFSLSPPVKRYLARMESNVMRAGFLLQLAYFRANARFYPVETFKKRDIQHVRALLKSKELTLTRYDSKTISKHRRKILSLLDWTPYDTGAKEILSNYALRQAACQAKPRQIFIGMVDQCWRHQFSIPSYTELSEIITASFNQTEDALVTQLAQLLNDDQRQALDALLSPGDKINTRSRPKVTEMKKINQGLRPSDIQENLATTKIFGAHHHVFEPLIHSLSMNDQATEYYANWFQKADLQQITQHSNRHKSYLLLLAFIKHQYYLRQDALVDCFKKSVTATLHAVKSRLSTAEQATKNERNEAIQLLNNSHKSMTAFAKSVIAVVEAKGATPSEKYYKIEALVSELESLNADDEAKIETLDGYLSREARNQSYFDLVEALSNKLQRRVSGIVSALAYDRATSCPDLMRAIDYFNAQDGKIGSDAPTDFLDSSELKILRRDDKIVVPLYKSLLFFHMAKAIKSGELNLRFSYAYRAIQDYLIGQQHWDDNKDKILRETGLDQFADGPAYLDQLKGKLDARYQHTNVRIKAGENLYAKLDGFDKVLLRTPAVEREHKEYVATTLANDGITPVLQVLKEVNAATEFTKSLKHFSTKRVKMKPTEETLLACVIGRGCNIGIRKLANISTGISEHVLHNTATWCLNLKNVQDANRRIIEAIQSLDLANSYIQKPSVLHSSSDGRKVDVAVDSLHANYSYKYFGKDKGVTMYTFVDERQSLFHSTVFSASDREAAYVIDGLIHNDVPHSHIHSTDTHGYTEQLFAATHFIGVDFAPRFKNIANQRIYGFSSRGAYQRKGYPLVPSRRINQKLILKHWDDILRFMATIKTNHATASQLFKRLSSYANTHPLYRALKEFGRIIISQFILTYYDDVELRQQIQKQLNRIELTNKFAHAVFFDNDQAFQDGMKDEQELSTACQVLLQNAIILWNYMYLSNLIINTKDKEQRTQIVESINQGSVITWSHINLRGEYDFTRRAANEPKFEFRKIRALKL